VSLRIAEREVLGLVGESGCGKSTLGRTIVGLHEKTAGEVAYRDEVLPARYRSEDFRRWSRKVQMIFQDPSSSLNERMTLREIVAEGPLLHGMWRRSEVPASASASGSPARSRSSRSWSCATSPSPPSTSRCRHKW